MRYQKTSKQNKYKYNQGFTLIELLIAMVLSLFLINGLMAVFSSTVRGSADSLKVANLSQEMRAVMEVITGEIRRAGYWDNPVAGNANPFGLNEVDTTAGVECIRYSYDAADGNDFRGFRIRNNAIEWKRANANFNCNAANWEAITDNSVVSVTGFTLNANNSQCSNLTNAARSCDLCNGPAPSWQTNDLLVYVHLIDIQLDAQMVADGTVNMTLNDSVRMRNDEVGTANSNYNAGNHACGQQIDMNLVI